MIESDFERARRRSSWHSILRFFTGKPSLLLPFDLVRSQIQVRSGSYKGIREIEIDRIIGSVNRYEEFDREFLPKTRHSAHRWSNVRQVFESDVGFPPIKVYQLGDAYFVVDGNHRVSVARQLGVKTIEAEVTSFRPNVPIRKDTDISDLIIKREYSDFLEHTRLDRLRPEQRIEFTRPGGYGTLMEHIEKRRYFLGLERGAPVSHEEAVVSWYDGLYRPLVEIFRQERLLHRFPRRTEADLYVWVTDHLYYLREQRGDAIGLVEATRDFEKERSKRSRVKRAARRIVGRRVASSLLEQEDDRAKALTTLSRRLALMERRGIGEPIPYRVPIQWLRPESSEVGYESVKAVRFWREAVDRIFREEPIPCLDDECGAWARRAVVYNLFVRASCGIDHDADGEIAVLNRYGLRETGTFLKAVALLPYIRALGCNVVHLLPISRIGREGRKGSLGSPYAIANPYQIDESLAEPIVGLGPDLEFKAFVEAAHLLGIRVVLEVVLRTAAKDSEWIVQHPEWFYWIREDVPDAGSEKSMQEAYRSPEFPGDVLAHLKSMVEQGEFEGLPPPPEEYRMLFKRPPVSVALSPNREGYVGTTADGTKVRVPGAFSDWPPDDIQPPWDDVTYLRLYDHPDFNYIAYNTVRMYDTRLATPENAVDALWEKIAGILPHFQDRFGIDGAMIDMGHALPSALKARIISGACGVDRSFTIWDENFESTAEAEAEGYNAVMGNLWWTMHRPDRIHALLERYATHGMPLPMLAGAETHNTPRSAARKGGIDASRFAWAFEAFLPSIPFVHSGFELGETIPVNTGLDFSPDEAARYPEELLPLYNATAYGWDDASGFGVYVRDVLALRARVADLVVNPHRESFLLPKTSPDTCVAYVRKQGRRTVLVVGNPTSASVVADVNGIPMRDGTAADALHGVQATIASGRLQATLAPWQCAIYLDDRS